MGSSHSYSGKGKVAGAGETNMGAGPGPASKRVKPMQVENNTRQTPSPKVKGMKVEYEGE